MAKSKRIGMPLLAAGQAQKEVTHNEALLLLDAIVNSCCIGSPANAPPQNPEFGASYICGSSPTGPWSGYPDGIATWSESGWRFVEPYDGLETVERASGRTWRYMSGAWTCGVIRASEVQINGVKVVGVQQPAIANASGGTIVDAAARDVLSQVLNSLRAHGLIAAA